MDKAGLTPAFFVVEQEETEVTESGLLFSLSSLLSLFPPVTFLRVCELAFHFQFVNILCIEINNFDLRRATNFCFIVT